MGIVISIFLFALTFPLKVTLKSLELATNVSLTSRIQSATTDSEKIKLESKKILLRLLSAIKALLSFLRIAILVILFLSMIVFLLLSIVILVLIATLGSSVVLLLAIEGINTMIYIEGSKSELIADDSTTGDMHGTYAFNPSATTAEIINMSEEEIWAMISEGRFNSYEQANAAAQADFNGEQQFWSGMLTTVTVPCWKWVDDKKQVKQSSTCSFQVNKHLAQYFSDFMTDLYNCQDRYVIVSAGGFAFRTKNNGTGTSALSAHSFGTVLDINPQCDGMGSYAAGYGNAGLPYRTANGNEVIASECCTFDNSWRALSVKYQLDWGGSWSHKSLDPMHFSLVGDTKKDGRNYKERWEGRIP